MRGERGSPLVLHTRVVRGTGGGPEKTILNSPRFLLPHGYNALCAYMHPPADPGFEQLRRKAESLGATLVDIEDRGPWDLRVAWRLARLCRSRRVAIWHGHDYKSNALGLLLRRFWPMKLVSTVHGWGVQGGRTPLYYKIDRLCLRRYEAVICVSEDLRDACVSGGVAADRCVVIENAIDGDQYRRRHSAEEAKRSLGLDPARTVIGSVGRLSAEKNFEGLIRAVARLVHDGLDVALVLAGDGDRRAGLQSLADGLGLGDRVRLLGFRADTIELYEAMDLFVLNSLREGLPNVVLEALAMEVPVVATRVAGIPRLIEHEANGLLIDPGAEDQLGIALVRALADADLRARLAAAGRRTIQSRYSFEVRMEKVRGVYDRLLASGH
jgi:glycosyltransferase involved in cell wall biosynthesis